MHHPLGDIDFLVWEIFMAHDECVNRWNPPPLHPNNSLYNHQPLQPLPLTCVWPLVPAEGLGVHHPGNFWGIGPMAESELYGSWHCVSSIFMILVILRSMEWPAPDYQKSLVFINETGEISQMPLLMKNMTWKLQRLTYMFNIIYGCFRNQIMNFHRLLSWCVKISDMNPTIKFPLWSALHPGGIFFLQRKDLGLYWDLNPAIFSTTHTQLYLSYLRLFDKK